MNIVAEILSMIILSLDCMPDLLKFPYFHQDRSHLVNSATILPKLLDTIKFGLLPYSLSTVSCRLIR